MVGSRVVRGPDCGRLAAAQQGRSGEQRAGVMWGGVEPRELWTCLPPPPHRGACSEPGSPEAGAVMVWDGRA